MANNWFSRLIGKCPKKEEEVVVDNRATQFRQNATPASDTTEATQSAEGSATVTVANTGRPAAQTLCSTEEYDVSAEWNIGDVVLDLYEVKGIFTSGGMGMVYRVHHKGWNIDLAVKSPRVEFFQTVAHKANFIREAETWITLGLHPHIVSCYYVRTLGSIPRVFAEYVEEGSLADWIRTRALYEGGHKKALERMLDISIQMAWGLAYAHEQGLIHQDVKPANVMMAADGTAKVTDFGLAKARALSGEGGKSGRERSILVTTGGMTPAYASPEQVTGQLLSRKTDIWSWGLSVLEMFVGKVTWVAGPFAAEALHDYRGVGPVDETIPRMPDPLVELLAHCFERDPKSRPENFHVVADNLRSIYRMLVDKGHARELPTAADLQANALNNRAVSMLDLGRVAEAEKFFDQALANDPGHPQTIYNRGLHLWRTGRGTDVAVVQALEQSRLNRPGDANVLYLLGLIHLERWDVEGAVAALSAAEQLNGGAEIQRALTEARCSETSGLKCLRTFEAPTREIGSVALSFDGRWVLSGNGDNTLRLWEVSSEKCLRIFEGHTFGVESVALSGDGRWALSGSGDETLRLWEVSSGKCLRIFEGHTFGVESVALSGDGRWALSGSGDKTLRLWEVSSGKCLRIFEGHTARVTSVALSVDGRLALSGSGDKTLRLWEVSSGKCLRIFEGHTDSVNSIGLSMNGHWALSGSGPYAGGGDSTLRLWEVSSGKCLRIFQGHTASVTSVALSADGRLALSGSGDGVLRLWEVSSGKLLRSLEGHTGWVRVALSADGHWALSGSGPYAANRNEPLRVWDLSGLLEGRQTPSAPLVVCRMAAATATLDVQKRFHDLLSAAERALSSGDFRHAWGLAVESRALPGYEFSTVALDMARRAGVLGMRTGLRSGWCWRVLEGDDRLAASVALSGDGRWVLSGGWGGCLRLWEVSSGKATRTFEGLTEAVKSVALSGNGRWGLSGGWDNTLRLWDVSSGRCLRTFEGHTSYVESVALSADGRLALSGSGPYMGDGDNTLRLWEVSSGKCLRIFEGHTAPVTSVTLSTDGCWALSGSRDRTLRLWEVSSGKCLRTFEGHASYVASVVMSVDGRWGLSGSGDNTFRLWEVSSGKCLKIFEGHAASVTSVVMSADGRWVLSGSKDKTIRLWEVSSGTCLRIFEGHTDGVVSVALSADGRRAVSGSEDRTLRLWELEWEYEFPEQKDWDDGARPYLVNFLTLQTPYVSTDPGHREFLLRRGRPRWDHNDWLQLLQTLQHAGYGWLNPEGIGRELEKMAVIWKGPLHFDK